jgi:hypothetical protein
MNHPPLTWLVRMARRVTAAKAKRMVLNLCQTVLSILGLSPPGLHSNTEYLETPKPRLGRLLLRSLGSFFFPSLIFCFLQYEFFCIPV